MKTNRGNHHWLNCGVYQLLMSSPALRRRRNTLLVAFREQFKNFARLKYKVFVEIVFIFHFGAERSVYSVCVIGILLVAGKWRNSFWRGNSPQSTRILVLVASACHFFFCAIILLNVRQVECKECFTLSGQSQLIGICINMQSLRMKSIGQSGHLGIRVILFDSPK